MPQRDLQRAKDDPSNHDLLQLQRNQSLASCELHRHPTKYRHCRVLELQSVLNDQLAARYATNRLDPHTSVQRYGRAALPTRLPNQRQIGQLQDMCGDRYRFQRASSPLPEFRIWRQP